MNPRPALFIFLILLLAGCSPIVTAEQPDRAGFTVIKSGETVGQTFSARYDGLSGIAVFLKPDSPGEGQVVLHLRRNAQGEEDLALAGLPLDEITRSGYYRFQFPPQPSSGNKDYYLQLEIQGEGSLQVGQSSGESYLDGALYQDQRPQEAQLTFRLAYDPRSLLAGLAAEGISWLVLAAAGLFLFCLPGWALLRTLLPDWSSLSWGEKLGLAGGLSLALYPLLFLWTGLAGLRLGPLYAWAPGFLGLLALIWMRTKDEKQTKDEGRKTNEDILRPSSFVFRPSMLWHRPSLVHVRPSSFVLSLSDIAFLIVIVLTFAVRFWTIRGLEAPLWGDSYQHTVIAQLLVDHGGLFDSWKPYAPAQTFTYHFGFHTAVSVFSWITGLPMPQAVLWTGQILNALAVLGLYPLAVRIGRSPWAGIAAVLIAGLLSPMPMFYTNWGRYTQLAGQVILPAAMYFAWSLLESKNGTWRWAVLALLAMGGLALTHYRVLVLAVLFFGALLPFFLRRGSILQPVIRTSWAGIGAGLLFLPWFIHVASGKILAIFASQVRTPASQTPSSTQEFNAIGNLLGYLPAWLWLLIPLAVLWGIRRREKGVFVFSLWGILVLFAANPNWLGLPGIGSLGNFTVFIAAYILAGVLVGSACGWLANWLEEGRRPLIRAEPAAGPVLLLLLALGLGSWGASQRLGDIRPAEYALVTRPDLRASRWIRENVPEGARFLVNSFLAFGDMTAVGSDAGWWLPVFAGRETNLPPMNYVFEAEPWPGYRKWVNTLTAELQTKGIDDPGVIQMLQERGITHVYIGQKHGRVNSSSPPALQPERLLSSPHFELVYHQDRVWVFEVK